MKVCVRLPKRNVCVVACRNCEARRYDIEDSDPLSAPLQLPLSLRNFHQKLLILNRNPTRKNLHRILEVAIKENLPRAINKRRARSVQNIETACKWSIFVGREREVRVAKQHEDVPDAELGRKGD